MLDKQRQKEINRRIVILARCPIPKDISKITAKRPQYSIKDKRKLSKYIVKHNLSPKEVHIATRSLVSTGQARSWRKDYIDGRYVLNLSVSVSRG